MTGSTLREIVYHRLRLTGIDKEKIFLKLIPTKKIGLIVELKIGYFIVQIAQPAPGMTHRRVWSGTIRQTGRKRERFGNND